MRILVLSIATLWFVGCSSIEPTVTKTTPVVDKKDLNDTIVDLTHFPQTSSPYLNKIQLNQAKKSQVSYEKHYFRVWNKIPKDSKQDAMWPFLSYVYDEMYGANLKLIEKSTFKQLKDNANFKAYKTLNKRAISLKHLNIRAFPTQTPMFRDPTLAGEGFPFDYMQNSTVSANKPLRISHYSKDKQWAYIFTSFTGGWVKTNEIVEIDQQYTKLWQKAKQIFLIKDNIPLYNEKGVFLFGSKVGMMLPLIKEQKDSYIVLSVSSYKNNQANYHQTKISKKIAHKGVMRFDKKNVQAIFDEVGLSKYGWGGMYGQRDCSSSIRDIFTPFGVWLPRNSYQQSKVGKILTLEGLSDKEKIKKIKKHALPFRTLLYKKGHVLIYIGTYDNEIVAFHNVWGVKTLQEAKEGRKVIGKSVYSSLKLGKGITYYDEESEILRNLLSMNILID